MVDLVKCKGTDCPVKETCFRYTAPDGRQTYGDFDPDDGSCLYYIPTVTPVVEPVALVPVFGGPHDGEWWPADYDALHRQYEIDSYPGLHFFDYTGEIHDTTAELVAARYEEKEVKP